MSPGQIKPKKVKVYMIISAVISLAIVLFILFFTVDANTLAYLAQTHIRYEFFLAAMLLNFVVWFIWGVRLRVLSRTIDPNLNLSWLGSTKIVLANLFLAGITPSMAGGEPVRIFLLTKEGMNVGGATAAVLSERLIDAIFILICIPFAFILIQDKLQFGLIRSGIIIGIIVFLIMILLFVYSIKNPEKTKNFLIIIEKKFARFFKKNEKSEQIKIITTIHREVDNFHNSMVLFVKHKKKTLLLVGLLTMLYWFVGFMIPSLLLLGLGLPPMIVESYAAQMVLLIIVMLPITPGSSGLTEGGMAALYGVIIGSAHGCLLGVFVLLFRFVTYHMHVIVGAIFQYRIFKSITSVSLESVDSNKS